MFVELLQILAGKCDPALGVLSLALWTVARAVQSPRDEVNELLVLELLGLVEKPIMELLEGVQAHRLQPLDDVDLGRVVALPVEVQELGKGRVSSED